MAFHFAVVLAFLVVGALFVIISLMVGKLIRPKYPEQDKDIIYECGEVPVGKAWFNFNPRFYLVALVFVVFEVEIALMLPVAMVFRHWARPAPEGLGWGALAFFEILAFVVVLAVGLVWVWVKGDLDWIKSIQPRDRGQAASPGQPKTPGAKAP